MPKPPKVKAQPVERRAVTVNQACLMLSVGRNTIYALMQSGRLKFFLIGVERRIPLESIDALMSTPPRPQTVRSMRAEANLAEA